MFNNEKLQHFSIRKLTIGVASVLIGISFLTGTNDTKVSADTVSDSQTTGEVKQDADSNQAQQDNKPVQVVKETASQTDVNKVDVSTNAETSNTDTQKQAMQPTTDTLNQVKQDETSTQTNASKTDTMSQANSASRTDKTPLEAQPKSNADIKLVAKQTATNTLNTTDKQTASIKALADNKTENQATGDFRKDGLPTNEDMTKSNQLAANSNADYTHFVNGKPETVTLSDGSTLTFSKDVIHNGDGKENDIEVTFKSNSFKAGDVYQFKFSNWFLPLKQGSLENLPSALGTTTSTLDDSNIRTITDTFTSTGSITQKFHVSAANFEDLRRDGHEADYLISKLLIAVTKNNQPDQSGAIYLQRGKVGNGSISNPQDAINLRNGTYIDGEKYHVTYHPVVSLWEATLKDKQTDFDLSLPDEFQIDPSSFQLTDKTGTPITDSKILSAFKWQSLGNNTYRLSFSNLPDNDVINKINYGGYKVAFDATLHANGKTTLTDKNGNGISVQLHEHQYNTKEPVYDSPVYKVLDPLKVATKASANPLIYWTPIYKNIPQSTKKYPSTGFSNNQNGNLIGGHVFNYDVMTNLTNAKLTLNIPDGFNLYSFDSQEKGKVKSMDVIFADGTRTTVQNSASFAGDNNKAIRQIVYYFNNIDSSGLYSPSSDDLTFLKADKFELATNYANGNLVEPKDKLTISGNLSSDQFVNSATMNFDVITVDDPVDHTIKESTSAWAGPNQTSSAPNQEGGNIGISFAPWDNAYVKLDNPVFYIQYNNLMSPELDKISVSDPNGGKAEYKAELLDNHMIKVSVTGEYYYESHGLFAFHLPFMNTTDATNSEKPVTIYIYDGKNGTRGDKINYGTAHASSKVIDGIHMDLEGTGTWKINVASGFTVDPGSITNTTASPVKDGKQDVHRDHADQFDLTYSLVNSKSTEKNNLVDVVNLPGTWDGKSGFNVALDAQPYLIDVSTGERIDPSKYTIEYSNDRSQNKFTDSFSNDVQAIRIRYGLTMPVTASWRLVVPVKDDHVYDHEGKPLHLSDLLYGADENTDSGDFTQENGYYVPKNTAIKPYLITADSSASATVTVGGISHVKTYVHYQDANGTDHLVELPDQAKTFDEGVDTISRDKFITSLSDADKALLPAQMVLDYNNPTVKLADNKFLDGYTTGDFKLGDKATYYTDGMQVIFEGKLPINVTNEHKVTITVHKKQEKLENNQVVTVALPDQTFDKTLTISGQKNPFTGDVKWDSDNTTGTIHIDIPDIDGYSKNEASRDVNIDMNSKDSVINVLYKLPRHTITYIYLAPDGKGSTYRYGSPVVVTGVPNQSLDAHLTAPDGYVFADPQQATAKSVIGKDDQTIFIDLKNTYHAGNTDTKTIDRTINYLDDEDHSKAVASPVVQHGILKRVEVVDNTGKVLGYGTVIDDGEGYTLSDAYVPTTNWDEVVSPDLTKQGYEPASVAKVDATVLTGDTQPATVNVYYKHHLVSVDINSHDKHGVSDDQLTRQVSQTVHFVYEDGTKVQDDNIQDRTFNRTLTVDAVNGKVIDNGEYTTNWTLADGEQPTFDAVNAPVVKGYFADNKGIASSTTTPSSTVSYTITYYKLGRIIAVDKDDNPINGVTPVTFNNDENDATKAVATNVPSITNYHLANGENSTVTPTGDLSKDVKVTYDKDTGSIKVTFVDDTTGKTLDGVGYNVTADFDTPITYTTDNDLAKLTNEGYDYISTDSNLPKNVGANTNTVVTVHVVHGMRSQALTKDVNETIHFVDGQGQQLRDDNVQHHTLTRSETIDKVTGDVVPNGQYTTDWKVVDGQNSSYDEIDAPVITGYFADKAKVDKADVGTDNLTQTITYHKLGHIIAVDKDDNPIAGADSPQFANNESDATKAKAINAPVITNYHLVNGQPSVVQPTTDLSKDVKVVYDKDQGRVKVIFADDTTGNSLTGVGFDSGDADFNTPITYTTDNDLAKLASEGYDYVSTDGTLPKTVAGKTNTTITVHVKHSTTAIDENHPFSKYTKDDLQKTAKQTINYVDDNGNQLLNSITHTVAFNATGTVDKVTGNLVNVDNNGKIIDQNGKLNWTFASDGNSSKQGDSYSFDAIPAQRTILKNGKTYRFEKTDPVGVGTNGGVNAVTVTAEKPANQTVNVVYHLVTYHAGNIETKTVDRTINYLDDEDHIKSVSASVTQHGQLARTQILDDQGNVIGYGTVNQDGTGYTINNDYVPVKNWDAVVSPDLSSRGYEPASVAKVDASNLTQATQPTTVNVYYKHHLVSVDVNSKDKHGVSDDQLTKTVNETVHFVNGQDQKLRDDNTQTRTFNRTLTIDATDNHVIDNGKFTTDWKLADDSKDTYDSVDAPVIKGYFADAKGVGSATVIQDNIDKTVTYHKLGNIIPVDKDGNVIVGVPPVQFENDDTDPTKAKATSVPSITNWHTDGTTAVTPTGDLSKNIKVTYNKDQGSFKVIFTDDITGKTIDGVGTNITADFDTPITYNIDDDIKKLTDDGYEYDSTDGKVPNKITANESTTVTVHMKHGIFEITSKTPTDKLPKSLDKDLTPDKLTKTVTETISYVNEDGTPFTGQVPENAKQTITFTGTAYVDGVTGKLVNVKTVNGKLVLDTDNTKTPEIIWSSSKNSFDKVVSPLEKGYHVDKVSDHADVTDVAVISGITPDSKDVAITVSYAKDKTPDKPAKSNKPADTGDHTDVPTPQPEPTVDIKGDVPAINEDKDPAVDITVKENGKNNGKANLEAINDKRDDAGKHDTAKGLTNIGETNKVVDAPSETAKQVVKTNNSNASKSDTLPQTGNSKDLAVMALGVLVLTLGLGLVIKPKKD